MYIYTTTIKDTQTSTQEDRTTPRRCQTLGTCRIIETNYPGKRPQTVGGAKGDETSGGDDDDDDTQMRAQRGADI